MKEFTGVLIDGPDADNSISSSTEKVPVVATVEMWLDGKGPDKDVNITVIEGSYIWSHSDRLFRWRLENVGWFKRKPEQV